MLPRPTAAFDRADVDVPPPSPLLVQNRGRIPSMAYLNECAELLLNEWRKQLVGEAGGGGRSEWWWEQEGAGAEAEQQEV